MAGLSLTLVERAILANQYRIISKLDEGYAAHFHLENKIRVLEEGIEGEYASILATFVENHISEHELIFANRVLLMASNIMDYADELRGYDLSTIKQVQFDQRDEDGYLAAAQYWFDKEPIGFRGLARPESSHHATLAMYERMLDIVDAEIQGFAFTADSAKRVLDAGGYKVQD